MNRAVGALSVRDLQERRSQIELTSIQSQWRRRTRVRPKTAQNDAVAE